MDADTGQDWAWPQSHVESLGVATNSWTKYETITHVSGWVVGESRAWAAKFHFSCNGWRLAPLRGNKGHDLCSYAKKNPRGAKPPPRIPCMCNRRVYMYIYIYIYMVPVPDGFENPNVLTAKMLAILLKLYCWLLKYKLYC